MSDLSFMYLSSIKKNIHALLDGGSNKSPPKGIDSPLAFSFCNWVNFLPARRSGDRNPITVTATFSVRLTPKYSSVFLHLLIAISVFNIYVHIHVFVYTDEIKLNKSMRVFAVCVVVLHMHSIYDQTYVLNYQVHYRFDYHGF